VAELRNPIEEGQSQTGSDAGMARPVIVPTKIKTGLSSGIIKQAGLDLDQFTEAL
jgi:hypothetical protein